MTAIDAASGSAGAPAPQQVVTAVLAAATTTDTIAIVDVTSTVNTRWAANSLTTNGATTSTSLTVVAFVAVPATADAPGAAPDGSAPGAAVPRVATGAVTATIGDLDEVAALVEAAESAARGSEPAADSSPLVGPEAPAGPGAPTDLRAPAGPAGQGGPASRGWDDPARTTTIASLTGFATALGGVLEQAAGAGVGLYGYVEHQVRSTWVGSSTGLRVRTDQAEGHLGITARTVPGAAGGGAAADPVRSAWVGRGFVDPADLDPVAMYAELTRRLGWSARRVDLPPGRYDTILPPDAAADLLAYVYFSLSGRDAADGHSVLSRTGGGGANGTADGGPDGTADGGRTRVGEQVVDSRVRISSDPRGGGFGDLGCPDRVVARSSAADQSVFDTGLPLGATDWVHDGTATALVTSRASARATGLPTAPGIDNLVVRVAGGAGSTDDLVAGMERGLLLTCLWYIREVDPRTLLLTGLTRDGVYLVEGGRVVAEVNNFRFNESPLEILQRFTAAGATVPALSREWGEYFPRTAVPALRIPDFTMSSVSEAT